MSVPKCETLRVRDENEFKTEPFVKCELEDYRPIEQNVDMLDNISFKTEFEEFSNLEKSVDNKKNIQVKNIKNEQGFWANAQEFLSESYENVEIQHPPLSNQNTKKMKW